MYLPDWSPDTIDKVNKLITKDYTVFEWGTGYSTIWLSQRAGQVITMEHNPDWHWKIKEIAKQLNIFNIDFNLYPLSDDRYYTHIHNTGGVDLVIVDGRNRMRCFNEAIKLGKPVMLDDSERERYKEAFTKELVYLNTLPTKEGQKATIFQMQKVTLLTTIWHRRKYLEEFLARWLNQPEVNEVILWDNSGAYRPIIADTRLKIINSSYNYGAWVRDVMAHLAENDIVIVSDDDVLIEKGFVAEMLKYYGENRYLGIWGNNFNGSYEDKKAIKANDIKEPTEVDAMVGLIYMIDRKHLFKIDHRDFMWTCYDIHLSGVFTKEYPQIKKLVVPNKLWHLTEEESDEFALNKHPDALKEKQELYERYWKK